MAYVTCPSCTQRLRAPDSPEPKSLRCPACSHVFRATGDGSPADDREESQDLVALAAAGEEEEEFVRTDTVDGRTRLLSAADEAMLRDFGSGTGLLDLTRDAYESTNSGDLNEKQPDATVPDQPGDESADQPAPAGRAAGDGRDRQFQIVATALTLANKLVMAHKSELVRARKNAQFGWIVVACLVVAGLAGFWAATRLVERERITAATQSERASGLDSRLNDQMENLTRVNAELLTAQKEARTFQGELFTSREQVAENKGSVQLLTSQLESANQKIDSLNSQVQLLKTQLEQAKAEAAEAEAAKESATTKRAE